MDFKKNRRRLAIIAAVIMLLMAAILVGWWYWRQAPPTADEALPSSPPPTSPPELTLPPVVVTPEGEARTSATRLARLFAERFATFSSQSRFESVNDIVPVTTTRFQEWLTTQYLPDLKRANPPEIYTGQTTRVLSVEVVEATETTSRVLVRTQQVLTSEGREEVRYPTLTVELVQQEDTWLVDRATWDEGR